MTPVPADRLQKLRNFLISIEPEWEDSIQDLDVINEALTHTSARMGKNHERLEFLGDAVLRLACSEFIDQQYPQLVVGKRSELRAQLVSDQWLADLGESIRIESILTMGDDARGDLQALKTLRAEATEAFIGALYLQDQGMKLVHQWLEPRWIKSAKEVIDHPLRFQSKSALQEWSQSRNIGLPRYLTEESNSRHGDPNRFHTRVLLKEQFTAEAWGRSRKEAEQRAAEAALQTLEGL